MNEPARNFADEIRDIAQRAPLQAVDGSADLVLDPRDPYTNASEYISQNHVVDGVRTLHEQSGVFYAYDGRCYPELEPEAVRAGLWAFMSRAHKYEKIDGEMRLVPYKPTTGAVNNVLDATRAQCHLPRAFRAPCFMEPQPGDPPSREVAALENGLLHVPTRTLYAPTPRFYTHNALDFAFDPDCLEVKPQAWLDFLHQIWGDDAEAIMTLQEIFGYLLLPDTTQQKIFLIVGPKRSGKGTIARVLRRLLGDANVCAPTLASMSQNFGLWPLIGKLLAIISDARLGSRADQAAIAERLLAISGEDALTIDRKHLPPWTGQLATRFLVLTNELPRLADNSGALASRFVVLTMERSFYGQEDPGLTDKLLRELPAIMAWALEGWDRLNRRGYFIQPESSAEAIRELEDLGSPISAFLRERCVIEAGRRIECKKLYEVWREWCRDEGREHVANAQTFGRDLRAAVPGLRTVQSRTPAGVSRFYEGVGLC